MSAARGGVLALALLVGLGACGGPGTLEVREAWVEPPPAGHGPAGGFLTIDNATGRTRRLVGASSPAAERVELHRSFLEGDVARMERLEAVELAAGETRLAPGGTHLMLFGARALAPGEHVVLRLELDGGERREVTAEVRPAGGGHAPHQH